MLEGVKNRYVLGLALVVLLVVGVGVYVFSDGGSMEQGPYDSSANVSVDIPDRYSDQITAEMRSCETHKDCTVTSCGGMNQESASYCRKLVGEDRREFENLTAVCQSGTCKVIPLER